MLQWHFAIPNARASGEDLPFHRLTYRFPVIRGLRRRRRRAARCPSTLSCCEFPVETFNLDLNVACLI